MKTYLKPFLFNPNTDFLKDYKDQLTSIFSQHDLDTRDIKLYAPTEDKGIFGNLAFIIPEDKLNNAKFRNLEEEISEVFWDYDNNYDARVHTMPLFNNLIDTKTKSSNKTKSKEIRDTIHENLKPFDHFFATTLSP